jgi:glycosyltransferase involved in cell wall biosynthesis
VSRSGPSAGPLEVVVVEPWYGGSHRAWADGLVRHSRHRVRLVTHPDRFWRWRLRGGAVTLAEQLRADVDAHGRPGVVVISSLVHGAALLGLARRELGDVPVVAYVHESQLRYPTTDGRGPDTDAAMANWQTLLAADAVWWNSAFHRSTVLEALPAFLRAAPDLSHADLVAQVDAKSAVVPVGVELAGLLGVRRTAGASADEGPLVVWNQRWEHDKDPLGWLRIMARLADAGLAFRLALAGERPRERDAEATALLARLDDRIETDRYLDADAYRALLLRSDVFLSCARHEFFGISVVEAIAAGCVPVLPDALSHPELLPDRWHEAVLYEPGRAQDALSAVLTDLDGARARVAGLRDEMARWSWPRVIDRYDTGLTALDGHRSWKGTACG